MRVVLIQRAATVWSDEDRAEGRTTLEPRAGAMEAMRATLAGTESGGARAVHTWRGEPDHSTAALVGELLGLPVRERKELAPLDAGAWTGLPWRDVESRAGKAYRQWRARPDIYGPPEGETAREAADRFRALLTDVRSDADAMVVVGERTLLLAAVVCVLSDHPPERFWDALDDSGAWTFETDRPDPEA